MSRSPRHTIQRSKQLKKLDIHQLGTRRANFELLEDRRLLSVTKIGDWFYMLYSGSTNNYGRKYSGKNRMAFGLARARHPEGPWEKYIHNPVLKPTGNEKDFDGIFHRHLEFRSNLFQRFHPEAASCCLMFRR